MSSFQNQTNSNKYCSQLDQLKSHSIQVKSALNEKCLELINGKHIISHQDNVRPYVSLMIGKNCYSLAKVLIHLPYSRDIAPLYFHLFILVFTKFS